MKSEKKIAGLGLLTAISASLCCITPVLALLAGASGLASTFSWIDPLRPYLIGLTILVIGFAWYQKLKTKNQIACDCEATEKTSFFQTKRFLVIVTVLAGLMLAFPMYANIFFPNHESEISVAKHTNMKTTEFSIEGMTCTGCEGHITHEVNKLPGIIQATASYENGNAIIEFDQTQTDIEEIEKAIANTGYSVTVKK